jgi:hypothetical protein
MADSLLKAIPDLVAALETIGPDTVLRIKPKSD